MRKSLPKNCTLKVNNCLDGYIILEVIGKGASTIAYLARYKDGSEHIIKEYYPSRLNVEREENGILRCKSEDQQQYDEGKELFKSGGKLQRELRNKTNLRNETPPIQDIFEVNNTLYLDVTPYEGKTWNRLKDLSLMDRMKICLAVAKLVNQYHKLGYLCLDLKPENIFILTNSSNEIVTEIIEFIDFDSICEKGKISYETPLSFTEEWAAPEQKTPYGYRKISERTDIYTVGELIFWSVFGRHSLDEEHRGFSDYPYDADENRTKKDLRRTELRNLLTDLFQNTLRSSVMNRYASMEDVINILEVIIEELSKKEYVITMLPAVSPVFVGREDELQKIDELLLKNRIIYISGMGGIGKSTLVRNYCTRNISKYDNIIYLQYTDSIKEMFNDDEQLCINTIYRGEEETSESYYERKFKKLKEILYDKHVLVVIDNYNRKIEEELMTIMRLQWKFIIVTRQIPAQSNENVLSLERISEEEKLYQLFSDNLGRDISLSERHSVKNIIQNVAGHTLVLELLAKQIVNSDLSIVDAENIVKKHGFTNVASEKIDYIRDEKIYSDTISNIISAVFDCNDLSVSKRCILKVLSFSPICGIQTKYLKELMGLETKDDLNELHRAGWVGKQKSYIYLHPVISEVISLWDWRDEYYNAIISVMEKLYIEIKLEYAKYDCPKKLVLCHQRMKTIMEEYPRLKRIYEKNLKKSGYMGEIVYRRIMEIDYSVPANYKKILDFSSISKSFLLNSIGLEILSASNIYRDLLGYIINTCEEDNENKDNFFREIEECISELVTTKNKGSYVDKLNLCQVYIKWYAEQKDFEKCHTLLKKVEIICRKYKKHDVKFMFYDILGIYYEAKLDGCYDVCSDEEKEICTLIIDSINQAIYHLEKTRKINKELLIAEHYISKANILMWTNPENENEISNILGMTKDIIEKHALKHSNVCFNYNMSCAMYYTLVKADKIGMCEFVQEALKTVHYVCKTDLELIDKMIIPVAGLFFKLKCYEESTYCLNRGIEHCEKHVESMSYIRKKMELLENLLNVCFHFEDKEKCLEIIKRIEEENIRNANVGIVKEISKEIREYLC